MPSGKSLAGWEPNQAEYAVANSALGEYETLGDPCIGDNEETTFGSQSTYVLPIDGEKGKFIFIGDRWTPDELGKFPYVWLPLIVDRTGKITIEWRDKWNLSVLKKREV